MPRAQGANAQLAVVFETTYGTAPVSGFIKAPFIDTEYGEEQKLITDDTIGHGREEIDPSQDVIDVQNNISLPVDIRNIGFWLKALLGAPVNTGTTPDYVHTYTSAASALPSFTREVGLTDVGEYFLGTGMMLDSLKFDFKRSGNVSASGTIIGQKDLRGTSSGAGTPTTNAYTRVSQFQGSILLNGSAIAGITEADMSFSNKLDAAKTITTDGRIEGIDPTVCECTGNLKAILENAALFAAAEGNTPVALQLGWTITANLSLIFTLPRVFLPRPKSPLKGAAGQEVSFSYRAVHDPSATYQLQAVLKNDVATY